MDNKAFVLKFIEALNTFDAANYEPYLAEEPVYWVGMNRQVGRAAFKANTDAGRILYPKPETVSTKIMAVLADGNWVSVLSIRKAATNRIPDYENIYAVFCEVINGKIATHVEVLDTAVAEKAFDLSAIQGVR